MTFDIQHSFTGVQMSIDPTLVKISSVLISHYRYVNLWHCKVRYTQIKIITVSCGTSQYMAS